MIKMTEKEQTKKQLEKEVKELTANNLALIEQLNQLSAGYQNCMVQANQLNMLVMKYEETINLLTARLIEGRTQGLIPAEDSAE
tara:strand:- start:170 stop:421 length:252 start_codon:yes stop_codon:yes gene_type:complete